MPVDFVVDWQGTEEETSKEIKRHLFCKKIDAGMPVVVGYVGKSRSGKTCAALGDQDTVYSYYGLDFAEFVPKVVMIKAKDWTDKVRPIIEESSPEAKKVKSLHMDEAKFSVSTDDWQKIKNKALRAVIGVGAVVQPMLIIIIAQLRSDIDPRIRVTLDYLFEVKRRPGHKPDVTCVVPYEKVYDLNNIKILPRALQGIIKFPDGTHQNVFPIFTPSMPRKEVMEAYSLFEKSDKTTQLIKLLDEVDTDAKKLEGSTNDLISLGESLAADPGELERLGKWSGEKWRFGKNAKQKLNRKASELKEIEKVINDKLKVKVTGGDVNELSTAE